MPAQIKVLKTQKLGCASCQCVTFGCVHVSVECIKITPFICLYNLWYAESIIVKCDIFN